GGAERCPTERHARGRRTAEPLDQQAAPAVPGFHRCAAASAIEDVRIRGQLQAARPLVRRRTDQASRREYTVDLPRVIDEWSRLRSENRRHYESSRAHPAVIQS